MDHAVMNIFGCESWCTCARLSLHVYLELEILGSHIQDLKGSWEEESPRQSEVATRKLKRAGERKIRLLPSEPPAPLCSGTLRDLQFTASGGLE